MSATRKPVVIRVVYKRLDRINPDLIVQAGRFIAAYIGADANKVIVSLKLGNGVQNYSELLELITILPDDIHNLAYSSSTDPQVADIFISGNTTATTFQTPPGDSGFSASLSIHKLSLEGFSVTDLSNGTGGYNSTIRTSGIINFSTEVQSSTTPTQPNDLVRLTDLSGVGKYKGIWTTGQVLAQYDAVYKSSSFGLFSANSNLSTSANVVDPQKAINVNFGFNSSDADNIIIYNTYASALSNFTPLGDLQLAIGNIIPGTDKAVYPLFSLPLSSPNLVNQTEFILYHDANGTSFNGKYRVFPFNIPADSAWHELVAYAQSDVTFGAPTGSAGIYKIHVDCYRVASTSLEFRLRVELISGGTSTIFFELEVRKNSQTVFSAPTPSRFWSLLATGTPDPNTVIPNWRGTDTNTIAKLPGQTLINGVFVNESGISSSFTPQTINKIASDVLGTDPTFYIDLSATAIPAFPSVFTVYSTIDGTDANWQKVEPVNYNPFTKILRGMNDPSAAPSQKIKIIYA